MKIFIKNILFILIISNFFQGCLPRPEPHQCPLSVQEFSSKECSNSSIEQCVSPIEEDINYNYFSGYSINSKSCKNSINSAYEDLNRKISGNLGISYKSIYSSKTECVKGECVKELKQTIESKFAKDLPSVEVLDEQMFYSPNRGYETLVRARFLKSENEFEYNLPEFSNNEIPIIGVGTDKEKFLSVQGAENEVKAKLEGLKSNSQIESETFKLRDRDNEIIYKTYSYALHKKDECIGSECKYVNLKGGIRDVCTDDNFLNSRKIIQESLIYLQDTLHSILDSAFFMKDINRNYENIKTELERIEKDLESAFKSKELSQEKWFSVLDNKIQPSISVIKNSSIQTIIESSIDKFDKIVEAKEQNTSIDDKSYIFGYRLQNIELVRECFGEKISIIQKIEDRNSVRERIFLTDNIENIDDTIKYLKEYKMSMISLLTTLKEANRNLSNYLEYYSTELTVAPKLKHFDKEDGDMDRLIVGNYTEEMRKAVVALKNIQMLLNTFAMEKYSQETLAITGIIDTLNDKWKQVRKLSNIVRKARILEAHKGLKVKVLRDMKTDKYNQTLPKDSIIEYKDTGKSLSYKFIGECGIQDYIYLSFNQLNANNIEFIDHSDIDSLDLLLQSEYKLDFNKSGVEKDPTLFIGEGRSSNKVKSIKDAMKNAYLHISRERGVDLRNIYNGKFEYKLTEQSNRICSANHNIKVPYGLLPNVTIPKHRKPQIKKFKDGNSVNGIGYKTVVIIKYPMPIDDIRDLNEDNFHSGKAEFTITRTVTDSDEAIAVESAKKEALDKLFKLFKIREEFLKEAIKESTFLGKEVKSGVDNSNTLLYKAYVTLSISRKEIDRIKKGGSRGSYSRLPKNLRKACFQKDIINIRNIGESFISDIESQVSQALSKRGSYLRLALNRGKAVNQFRVCKNSANLPDFNTKLRAIGKDFQRVEILENLTVKRLKIIAKRTALFKYKEDNGGWTMDRELQLLRGHILSYVSFDGSFFTLQDIHGFKTRIPMEQLLKNYYKIRFGN